ncbi:MAG: gamma carbonic anhydrase family protein [Ignavibacterium sp.]|jgi:carbonic anhydrase/acetyltransferase-like protein (isoleucine patch superfamily)|uniref:gamma carbonic anhydrase family protein n=1 Tax=Ignavibacterium sp. TaxID=2651167 RepID=UPI003298FB63
MEKEKLDTSAISQLSFQDKLFPYLDLFPKIHPSVFLAEGVKIIGDVEIGEDSSVWYNTVIRGDVHYIKIGKMTNIQDCSMLHVTNGKYPLNIGNKVTIGHAVKLHGCTLQDLCLIGIGAIILDGAVVEEKSMVAAGSVVKPNFIVPSGKLVAGVPAKVVRDLTQQELDEFEKSAQRYKKYTELTVKSLIHFSENK